MNKKGIIVIQFNWMYVLIIGGLILAMFIGIIVKQSEISETSATGELQRTLQTILSGASTKAKRTDLIEMPKTDIEYDQFGYRIGSLAPFSPGVSFSPSKISVRGRQLLSWTLGWHAPYKVTNFLYVTSTQVRYVLVGDYELIQELQGMFPEALNADFNPSPASFIDNNNYKVKFVFINADPLSGQQLMSKLTSSEINVVKITGNEYSGEVEFYDYDGALSVPDTSYYMGIPGLIAAIFSDDVNAYNVNMDKAYKKLAVITEIYMDKIDKLAKNYEDENSWCHGRYNPTSLQTLKNAASSRPIGATNIALINGEISALNALNKQLQISSCPMLY